MKINSPPYAVTHINAPRWPQYDLKMTKKLDW